MPGWISFRAFRVALACLLSSGLNAVGFQKEGEEIPIERCDQLPVISVSVQGKSLRFLVDTAATSMLNIASFAEGRTTAVEVTSWKGTNLTSARQVTLPELVLGSYRLTNLSLPAIDLSPIAKACGGRIDGILGVDLLEKMGATLDLKNRVAVMGNPDTEIGNIREKEFYERQQECVEAFNRRDRELVTSCLDSQVALFRGSSEVRGQGPVIDYLQRCYFDLEPPAHLDIRVHDSRFLGDAVWFGYDLIITLPKVIMAAKGMAICRKSDGQWRLLNMHNSFEEQR
jgi:hypothetical protein